MALEADTHGRVTDHVAVGVDTAGSDARIGALVSYASLVSRALDIVNALWSTVRRFANVIRQTGASWITIDTRLQLGVGTARRLLGFVIVC